MRSLLVAFTVLAMMMPVGAEAVCYTTSTAKLDTDPVGAGIEPRFYFVDDCSPLSLCPGMWSIWVYEEANGIPGLQRDDDVRSDVDACRAAGVPVTGDAIRF